MSTTYHVPKKIWLHYPKQVAILWRICKWFFTRESIATKQEFNKTLNIFWKRFFARPLLFFHINGCSHAKKRVSEKRYNIQSLHLQYNLQSRQMEIYLFKKTCSFPKISVNSALIPPMRLVNTRMEEQGCKAKYFFLNLQLDIFFSVTNNFLNRRQCRTSTNI